MSISKIDAARRATESAIKMLFREDDPVPIALVVGGARQILVDLAEKHGGVELHNHLKAMIKPGYEKKLWATFNKVPNFLKHADRDPDECIEVPAKWNDGNIFMCCLYHEQLASSAPILLAYVNWYAMLNPAVLNEGTSVHTATQSAQAEAFRQGNRDFQLEVGRGMLSTLS